MDAATANAWRAKRGANRQLKRATSDSSTDVDAVGPHLPERDLSIYCDALRLLRSRSASRDAAVCAMPTRDYRSSLNHLVPKNT